MRQLCRVKLSHAVTRATVLLPIPVNRSICLMEMPAFRKAQHLVSLRSVSRHL